MNSSINECLKPRNQIKELTIVLIVLCLSLLDSGIASAEAMQFVRSYRLTDTVNFQQAPQCPSDTRSYFIDEADSKNPRCRDISRQHLFQYYNPYNSIFHRRPVRPLSFQQQIAMLELFDSLGLTGHEYDLSLMVDMTQYKNLSRFSQKQFAQLRDWRQLEGEIIEEKACKNNSLCKEQASMALFKMGMYAAQLPKRQHYDYTLFLGGSIQEMQLRMVMMLSLFDSSLHDHKLDLGEIVALTCDRLVLSRETDDRSSITIFDVSHASDSGLAKALISDEQEAILTETTGYQAILQSLKMMARSPEYFNRFKETGNGYHPTLPVDFLSSSFESKLYKKQGHTFQLDAAFPKLLIQFFQRYPSLQIIETKVQNIGELKKRPTTKGTVKEWLARRGNKLSCKNPGHCKILAISNAPNTFYQHTAVLQGLEDSISTPARLIYELSTAGSAASMNIPTDSLLDNLTKLLYLELNHPEN